MNIAIDCNEANVAQKVGVSVYTYELLHYFSRQASEELRFTLYLRDLPRTDLPKETTSFRYKTVVGPRLWRDVFLPANLYMSTSYDVFFSPAHYTPRFCPTPVVVTLHDLSYLYYPDEFLKKDLYKLTHWTEHAAQQATKIIAVSNATKKDIMKNYQVSEDKVEMIYNGYSQRTENRKPKSETVSKFEIRNSKFFLYVGTLQPRKNLATLIEAFSRLPIQYQDLKLVIVGKKGWLYEQIFQKVVDLKLEDRVIFTGYLPDEEVASLYQKAHAFIHPSLYEGFGIPVLEAMSQGCPVIAADSSSLPEVGGNACLYFDPHDTVQLSETIKKLLDDKNLRAELIKKGKDRVKQFSWEKCGHETLEVLKNVAR